MSLTSFVITASESTGDPAVNPFVIGGIALGTLLFSLFVLLMIAGGREHS
ncbi:hypothetical protein [Nocardioides alcanivorans]|nr:hypothetical protein [Nocardioides alcanivorans]